MKDVKNFTIPLKKNLQLCLVWQAQQIMLAFVRFLLNWTHWNNWRVLNISWRSHLHRWQAFNPELPKSKKPFKTFQIHCSNIPWSSKQLETVLSETKRSYKRGEWAGKHKQYLTTVVDSLKSLERNFYRDHFSCVPWLDFKVRYSKWNFLMLTSADLFNDLSTVFTPQLWTTFDSTYQLKYTMNVHLTCYPVHTFHFSKNLLNISRQTRLNNHQFFNSFNVECEIFFVCLRISRVLKFFIFYF